MYTISIEVLYSISSVAGAVPHQCFSDQKLDWFKLDKNWGRIESCQSGFLNVQFYTKYVVLIYLCSQNYKYEVTKLMHESIPGVTTPPPRDTPENLPDRQFTGVGNLPFIISCTCTGPGYCYSR